MRYLIIFIVVLVAGCHSPPPIKSSSQPTLSSPVIIGSNAINTDELKKKQLNQDLPNAPSNGKRTFIGLKTKDCKRNGKIGTYVIGYFFKYGYSPGKEAGIIEGDEIVEINDNRININSDDLEIYIKRIYPKLYYKFKIIRNGKPLFFEIKSEERIPGNPVLTKTDAIKCSDNKNLNLEDI